MSKEEYKMYLLKEVQWWSYLNPVKHPCYHGNVFGVHTIMEVRDLEKMALKHQMEVPYCLVGG